MIRTKWHKVLEALKEGHLIFPLGEEEYIQARELDEFIPDMFDVLIKGMNDSPKYYLQDELSQILERADCVKSVMAMQEAGIMRLPYPLLTVEHVQKQITWFTHVWETQTDRKEEYPFIAQSIGLFSYPDHGDWIMVNPMTIAISKPFWEENYAMSNYTALMPGFLHDWYNYNCPAEEMMESCITVVKMGVFTALLLLNTRGVEKEVVTPQSLRKLNRNREKRKRPSIPAHIILRVGHVYDRKGNAIRFVDQEGHKRQPLHWRSGYTATRWVGKGRKESRIVYVEPYIVNYAGADEDKPAPTYEVRW